MPQIREYTAENDVLRPTETGIDATAQAARRVGAFYNQAGEVLRRSSEDRARAAEAQARAAGARAQAAGALATEEKARFGAYGEGVKAVGSAVEMAENYAGHQEIGHAAATLPQATLGMTNQWNSTFDAQAKADPNNTSIQTGFMQGKFEPWAQKFVSGFNTPLGQDWANEQVNHLRNHLFEKTTADMSSMAQLAVKSNWDKAANSWENTARADPSTVDFLVGDEENGKPGQIDRIADALISTSPNLKGIDAAKFRIEGVDAAKRSAIQSGALGVAEKASDPESAVRDYVSRYPNLINPEDADKLIKSSMYFKHLNQSEDRAQRVQRDYDYKNDFNNRANALEAQTMPKNVGDRPQLPTDIWDKMRELATHPGAAQEVGRLTTMTNKFEAITDVLARKAEPDKAISDTTEMDLMRRISGFDPMNRPRITSEKEIWDATKSTDVNPYGKLTVGAIDRLRKELDSRKTPEGETLAKNRDEFIKRFGGQIDDMLGTDPEKTAQLGLAIEDMKRQESELRAKNIDPNQLYNSRSEYFFGNNMQQYKQPLQQQLQQRQLQGAVPESLRGIAALQYNKRLQQYRDETTGKIYDRTGNEIKKLPTPERPEVPVR